MSPPANLKKGSVMFLIRHHRQISEGGTERQAKKPRVAILMKRVVMRRRMKEAQRIHVEAEVVGVIEVVVAAHVVAVEVVHQEERSMPVVSSSNSNLITFIIYLDITLL
jgi:hypothetical protein